VLVPRPQAEKRLAGEPDGATVVLEDEGARAEIVPTEGGRTQRLTDRTSGRELLWHRGEPGPWPRDHFLDGCPGERNTIFPNDAPYHSRSDQGGLWSAAFAGPAARALGRMRRTGVPALPALTTRSRDDLDQDVRAQARWVLARPAWIDHDPNGVAVMALVPALGDEDSLVREEAPAGLGALSRTAAGPPAALRRRAGNAHLLVRAQANEATATIEEGSH